jgi:phage tail tape-measure protein
MAEQKALVTLKDGTKITVDDLSQLSQYSDRQDMESITFFGDDEAPVAANTDAGTVEAADAGVVVQTVATVEQPKADPVVPKPQPATDHSAAITAMVGALAGAVSSAGMPALTNLVKNLIKSKLKGKKGGEQKEEQEEPTDCKTNQVKANVKFTKLAARIAALENKPSQESKLFNGDSNPLEDLEERIEKLEKQLKTKGKKK